MLDQTHTISNAHKDEVFKIPHAPPAQVKSPTIPNSVKSQARGSCLPRPISTGIPRPVSKIPGPRMLRPPSAKPPSRLASKSNDGY
ncbi:hypothetical protein QE152_g8930 [Popillia japonica]|uniref:Uncharacterized protein n=1 Tax=Popillia japonica TaxID=7064 RepID=A0AAW1M155_POPJA